MVNRCQKRINLLRGITGTKWGCNKHILLTIYKGLIRSIIDYGSTLYNNASKYLLNKLDSIQYKSLIICLGALKGTALSSLQFEANEQPLFLRRKNSILKHLVKVAYIPNYNISDIFNNDCNFNIAKKNYILHQQYYWTFLIHIKLKYFFSILWLYLFGYIILWGWTFPY